MKKSRPFPLFMFLFVSLLVAFSLPPKTIIEERYPTRDGFQTQTYTFAELEKKYGHFARPNYEVSQVINHIVDSLKKQKIDTFLIFQKKENNWLLDRQFSTLSKNKNRQPLLLIPIDRSESTYLFWIVKGKYFVRRVDQFAVSKTVERPESNHYILYSYYLHNKYSLSTETELSTYQDTIGAIVNQKSNETMFQIITQNYQYGPYLVDCNKKGAQITILQGQIGNQQFDYLTDERRILPNPPNKLATKAVRNANDPPYCYQNINMKKNEWMRLVQNEILVLEQFYFNTNDCQK
jgi:hypothetical protein